MSLLPLLIRGNSQSATQEMIPEPLKFPHSLGIALKILWCLPWQYWQPYAHCYKSAMHKGDTADPKPSKEEQLFLISFLGSVCSYIFFKAFRPLLCVIDVADLFALYRQVVLVWDVLVHVYKGRMTLFSSSCPSALW